MTAPAQDADGGAERLLLFNLKTDADDDILGFTTDWINALAEHFASIRVITMDMGRLDVAKNVEVVSVGKERGWSEPRRALQFYRLLAQTLSESKIDACFAHMMPLFVAMAGPILRVRKIPITMWYAHKAVPPVLRVATMYSRRVLTSTPAGFQLPSTKLKVVGQGIDTVRFSPLPGSYPEKSFRVLHVGRLSAIKRIEVLLEAVALLKGRFASTPVNVTLVGRPQTDADHRYARVLRERADLLGITDHVHFQGSVPFPQVHRVYTSADCMVNPSEAGALDKTVLEAMSCGLPIVTANTSYRNVVGSELAAWVTRSEAEAIAERMQCLMEMSTEERRALGGLFRQVVERDHSLTKLAARIAAEIKADL